MNLRLTKPWIELTAENVRRVPGQLGVFQLADESGEVVYIGYAGGKSLFGLRTELERSLRRPPATRFRYEVNMQYLTRYKELLMLHKADRGEIPQLNQAEPPVRLGRIG